MDKKQSKFLEAFDRLKVEAEERKDVGPLFSFRGGLYPALLCSAENFEAMENMEARNDDVLLSAYPKCGTNWTLKILNDIMAASAASYSKLSDQEYFVMLEFGPTKKFEIIKKQPSPRLFATHFHYDDIPKSFIEKKAKILVIFRNPKDTAVSYYHFYNKNPLLPTVQWDEFFRMFMSGEVCWKSYFEHALVWDKHMDDPNILIITFEELKENLYEGVKLITDFYQLPLTDEKIKAIAEKSTFEEMRNMSHETHGAIAPILFRKGAVGDWKTLFTEAQSKEMDAKFEKCLAGTKLGAKLKYDKYCKF